MNYIITGGTGFIGTHLANLIKEQDENAQVWIWILWILKYISTDDTDEHGDLLAEQCLNCSDYLSADVRQMLYGFSSVSDLFNICGLYWSAGGLLWGTRIMAN